MRVKMLQGVTEPLGGGASITWHAGCVFEVEEERGRQWIREGAAEDDAKVILRRDLLTLEEAIAAGLAQPPELSATPAPAEGTPAVTVPAFVPPIATEGKE